MTGAYIVIGIVLLLIIWLVFVYNNFIKYKLKVDNNYSHIDIQCKKRFDLVTNLVETVKGYAHHESDTLEKVIKARNNGLSADNPSDLANSTSELTETLVSLFALSEAYPELKADVNFRNLQTELVSLEKEIAISRQIYNDSVMVYNNKIMIFPNNIFANIFHFKNAGFFEAKKEETESIKINL